jgi:uncharacterized LabA/DUF88 family protein
MAERPHAKGAGGPLGDIIAVEQDRCQVLSRQEDRGRSSLALRLTVSLVTDLLLLASRNAFDVAIICAGDADFFRAVEGVKEMGKEIYIASFDESCATKLKDASLGYFSLTMHSDKI